MKTVWIAQRTPDEHMRDARRMLRGAADDKIVWIDDAETLPHMLRCIEDEGDQANLLVFEDGAGRITLPVSERGRRGAHVVAITASADPARALELLHQGADEVVVGAPPGEPALSDAEVRVESVPNRHEGGLTERAMPDYAPDAGPSCGVELSPDTPGRCAAGTDSPDGAKGHAEAAKSELPPQASSPSGLDDGPWVQGNMQRYVADLDEPDVSQIWPTATVPPMSTAAAAPAAASGSSGTAPLITVVSGCGGCGKSTLVAAMAIAASRMGLRVAVLDLDLMFGRLYVKFGADAPRDLACLVEPASQGPLTEEVVVRASTRIATGLTLWGPVDRPEQAELVGPAVEALLGVLRQESDLIVADTSTHWGDAVAAAVAASDRCLVVADARPGAAAASARAVDLVARLGVSRTRIVAVFNRAAARDGAEDAQARFEFTVALATKERIADGGAAVGEMAEVGQLSQLLAEGGAFAASVQDMTRRLAVELGCRIDDVPMGSSRDSSLPRRHRIKLPWGWGGVRP